ncbi:unnamed protein product [Sphagnum balticum]
MVCRSDAATQYVSGATIFGRCANFAIQAGTSVSFDGGQTDVTTDDEVTAYGYLQSLNCTNTLANSDLDGVTLLPGVYCAASGVFTISASALYLDAQGDASAQFIFQTTTTVITAGNTNITLVNGALAKNIFWQVGSSATLGASSFFIGQIFAAVSITIDSFATVVADSTPKQL